MVSVVGKGANKNKTCGNCRSKLEYNEGEVVKYKHTGWDGSTGSFRYITCPSCNHRVYLK